jgi:TRAP-type C4-dicarboxylate transport system substrate-binding protein
MTQTELKQSIHNIIDSLEDEALLAKLHTVMVIMKENQAVAGNDWWAQLSEERKAELEIAMKESEDENNLISHEEVMRESRKWLKK